MGFHITDMQLNVLFQTWQTNYHIYAPRNFSGGGRFSDTDCIRYGKIEHADEIVFDKKSDYSFKEVLTPVSQTGRYVPTQQSSRLLLSASAG